MLSRILMFAHRWLGVAVCGAFLLWFPSGIGMMYWPFPTVTADDRLDRAPALDPAKVLLAPQEAAGKAGVDPAPNQVRLNTFDGRPIYRFGGGRGGGGRGGARMVYADTGEEQVTASEALRDRAASAWTGQPATAAVVEAVQQADQWTVQAPLRTLRPLWKYSWPNGEQLYVGSSGEVLQYTTPASRLGAYLGPIPHWLYFAPLRRHQVLWYRLLLWTAMIATIAAVTGVVVGVWVYSPSRRYRLDGAPASIPYRGQKRWHTILGLMFGIASVTWAFSGLLSLDPFPRLTGGLPDDGEAPRSAGVSGALRGSVELSAFAGAHPRDVLAAHSDLKVKELQLTSFAGQPLYAARLDDGTLRMLTVGGEQLQGFDIDRIVALVKGTASNPDAVEASVIDQYDRYYLDRTRQQPLPVVLVKMNDEDRTRYYIDPRTALIAGTYSSRNWVDRWLFDGLHSLNFPWLYNYRPLWDIVVIAFMLGGTALSVTSFVLAWRLLGKKLARAAEREPLHDVQVIRS